MKVRFQRCLRIGFILVLLFGILVSFSSFAQERLKVALLPFVERNGEEAYLGYLIRDWVKRILEQEKTITICDVFFADNLVRSSRISWDTLLVSGVAQILAKRLNCDYIVTGSFRHRQVVSRDRIIVTPKLYRIVQGDCVDIPSEIFDGESVDLVARYVAEKILEALGFSPLVLEVPSLPLSNLLPLYQGLVKVDQAIRTYGENQYPDRPLWREAFSLVEETLKREPDYREGYYYLANMYRETKWWAKEAETWDLYLERLNHGGRIDGAHIAQVYVRLAYSYLNQKNRELALSYLQKALNLNPEYVEAYLLLGRTYYEEDNIEEAEKAYSKAYELDPSSKEAQYFVQMVGKARLFGKSAYETYTQGYRSFSQGDLEGAEKYLKEAVRLNPGFKEAYYWLGRTLYERGKLEEAESVWEKILEIDPFNSQVRRFLDKTQQERRYGREAVRHFQKGYELYEDGNYESALEPFKKAILQNPAFSEAHEYLARCYYRLGKTKEYLEEREKVVQLLTTPEDKG
ncbi:MAG: tetratricopeptide repeat protein, partial [Candidatus Caldatribacteriaceae bacterium]